MAHSQAGSAAPKTDPTATAQQITESVEETLADFKKSIGEISKSAESEIKRVGGEANTFVRENPTLAFAGAVGVGVLLGLALSKR
ncbi:MAG: hypothetical protein AAGI03_01215 [Pseudomonadota bacterium]